MVNHRPQLNIGKLGRRESKGGAVFPDDSPAQVCVHRQASGGSPVSLLCLSYVPGTPVRQAKSYLKKGQVN